MAKPICARCGKRIKEFAASALESIKMCTTCSKYNKLRKKLHIKQEKNDSVVMFLRSNRYGCENFEYETIEDAVAGLKRLYGTITKGSSKANDGIPREIGIVIPGK